MKAIHADPKEVRKIFSEKYIIPEFQRPYSWEIEQCDKLWEDIIIFFDSIESRDDKYFLGNIVIHPYSDSYAVIDGQQRLTSLLLLIKNLHQRAGVVKALEECIKIKDPLTSELTNQLRIRSLVLDKDKDNLYDIVFNNGESTPECNLSNNYRHFGLKIDEWWQSKGNSAEKLNELILVLLDQIVLLPIHCGSEDDALTIFETINNRGMSLSDADIFKAKLHAYAKEDKNEFIEKWNNIENHEWRFRILMHIFRAKENITGKEIALRTFFTENQNSRLSDWKTVIKSIQIIDDIENNWISSDKAEIFWHILSLFPNYYWNYPLYVYLHKFGTLNQDSEYELEEKYIEDFERLLEETLKYFYIKGVVYNSVNAVKDTTFKICSLIEENKSYIDEYQKSLNQDYYEFEKKIKNNQLGRYQKGLIILASYLNPNQDKTDLDNIITGTYHIEHILPKKWNNYDYWNENTWNQHLNSLGNLIPLEYKLNISAKNEFFDRKKSEYRKSKVQDAIDLTNYNDWTPDEWKINNELKTNRILDYFKSK